MIFFSVGHANMCVSTVCFFNKTTEKKLFKWANITTTTVHFSLFWMKSFTLFFFFSLSLCRHSFSLLDVLFFWHCIQSIVVFFFSLSPPFFFFLHFQLLKCLALNNKKKRGSKVWAGHLFFSLLFFFHLVSTTPHEVTQITVRVCMYTQRMTNQFLY